MAQHLKTKEHKKRLKIVKTEKPYTHEEAERAVGLQPASKKPQNKMVLEWLQATDNKIIKINC